MILTCNFKIIFIYDFKNYTILVLKNESNTLIGTIESSHCRLDLVIQNLTFFHIISFSGILNLTSNTYYFLFFKHLLFQITRPTSTLTLTKKLMCTL